MSYWCCRQSTVTKTQIKAVTWWQSAPWGRRFGCVTNRRRWVVVTIASLSPWLPTAPTITSRWRSSPRRSPPMPPPAPRTCYRRSVSWTWFRHRFGSRSLKTTRQTMTRSCRALQACAHPNWPVPYRTGRPARTSGPRRLRRPVVSRTRSPTLAIDRLLFVELATLVSPLILDGSCCHFFGLVGTSAIALSVIDQLFSSTEPML